MLLAVALADPALAASTSDIGRNIGREVNSWGKAILLGLAGLLAIPVLAKRDISGGLMLLLLVLIVGGFVFAQGTVEHAITGVWHAVAG
ncbi:MAG: hypothetical protein NVSMB25_05250 [Thermoleophilaceae bacterium]